MSSQHKKRRRYRTSSFASHPKSKFWSKRNTVKPNEAHSQKKYWFDCEKCGHEFDTRLSDVNGGSWCRFCSGRALCGQKDCEHCLKRSFASHPKSKFWSKRNSLKTHEVHLWSSKKFFFDCSTCGHEFDKSLHEVNKGTWCRFCAGRVCGKKDCQYCLKRSFASHTKSKFWSKRNTLKPHEVPLKTHTKFFFDCPTCGHDFDMRLSAVNNGRWCRFCTNKTERKVYDFLQTLSHKIKKEWAPKWLSTEYLCMNKGVLKTGRYQYRFDFLLPDLNEVIEVDGRQHFEQVRNWPSPLCQQIRDKYKEMKAKARGIRVTRLNQVDIWHDRVDWRGIIKTIVEKN